MVKNLYLNDHLEKSQFLLKILITSISEIVIFNYVR